MNDTPPFLCLQDVSKIYPNHQVHALQGVTFSVFPGETISLMGPSGCGKSTLLNLLGGIDRPTDGSIMLNNQDLRSLSDAALTAIRQTQIGFVFQFFNLLNTLTVAENVALPLEISGGQKARAVQDAVTQWLEAVQMRDQAAFYPSQLSGGQMQRVAIARALIHQPALILADEPTGNLDSDNGAGVMRLLKDLCRKNSQTLIMATHSAEIAAYTARVIRMKDGRILTDGAP